MLVVPIPIDLYMPHLLRAAKPAGYVGLVVILARTADAREQYTELGRDWTSLHDVTGPLIGVLCPSPSGEPDESRVIRALGKGVGVQGLAFTRAYSTDDRQFERSFWDSAARDPRIAEAADNYKRIAEAADNYKKGFATPRRPAAPTRLAAAWTEMATLSAQYFGIAEADLPCVVVMSLWEQTAVAVRLRPGLSLYQLLRATISNLGGQPARVAEMRQQCQALLVDLRTAQQEKTSAITEPGIIVLDNGLSGRRTGLDAAPRLKELVPHAKLFMFTAHADLKARADNEPAIDGFVLKTESSQLLALARLAGLSRATFLTPARPRPPRGPYGRRASVPAQADPVVRVDRPRPR